jgi:hypothetical protein
LFHYFDIKATARPQAKFILPAVILFLIDFCSASQQAAGRLVIDNVDNKPKKAA